jgi:hypothetical protein
VASVNGDAAAQMAAAGAEDEGLAEVAQEVEVAEMEAGSCWKRGARMARAMAKQGNRPRTGDGERRLRRCVILYGE